MRDTAAQCDSRSALAVISNVRYFDADGRLWVIGELRNNSTKDFLLASICFDFESNGQHRIERRYAGPMLIKGQEQVPFRTFVDDAHPGDETTISLSVAAADSSSSPDITAAVYRQLQVRDVMPFQRFDDMSMHVSGTVINAGPLSANNIYVTIGLYDKQKNLIGVTEGNVSGLNRLLPGTSMTFTLTFNRPITITGELTTKPLAEGRVSDNTGQ